MGGRAPLTPCSKQQRAESCVWPDTGLDGFTVNGSSYVYAFVGRGKDGWFIFAQKKLMGGQEKGDRDHRWEEIEGAGKKIKDWKRRNQSA